MWGGSSASRMSMSMTTKGCDMAQKKHTITLTSTERDHLVTAVAGARLAHEKQFGRDSRYLASVAKKLNTAAEPEAADDEPDES